MKSLIRSVFIVLVMGTVLVCMSGCNIKKRRNTVNKNVLSDQDTEYTKEFGSYTVKKGWIESKSHSSKGKYFYVKDGEDDDKKPNNISINAGTNKYSKNDHESFKQAIYRQLVMQVGKNKNTTINGNGSTTENGEIVYTFVIDSEDSVITQYYIVGDYKYVFVYESVWNKDNKDEVDSVAQKIVNSFKWAD